MSPAPANQTFDAAQALAGLPQGVKVFDGARRMSFVNDAYCDILGLPRGIFELGSSLESNVRLIAHYGVYGPGDPERYVREMLAMDFTRPMRRRLRRPDGSTLEGHHRPLPDGSVLATVTDTTALTQQREQSDRTAASLFQAVSHLRSGLAMFDADRRLVLHNWRFVELLGLSGPNLAPGLRLDEIVASIIAHAESDETGAAYLVSIASGRSGGGGTQRLRMSGRAVDVACDPLAGGGCALTATDVTRLAAAEAEASRRAAMLDATLQHIPHGIIVFGPDGRVTMVNQTYLKLLDGAPVAVGDDYADIIRRRAQTGEYGPCDAEKETARRLAFDVRAKQSRRRQRPSGGVIDVRTAPLPDGGHISVSTDVTALVEAEAEVRRTAHHMQAMVANIRHGIILWDQTRRIVAHNAYAEELLHTAPGVLAPGRSLEELIEDADARGNLGGGSDRDRRAIHLATQDRSESHADLRFTASGQVLDVRSDPVAGGGFVTTYTDVTEAQRAQIELKRAKVAAEAASLAKSQFLATISHELRTPLNAVIGYSEALLRSAAGATAVAAGHAATPVDAALVGEHAQAVQTAGRELLAMIDSILDVARLDAGRFDVLSDRVSIGRLIEHGVRQTASMAAAAEIVVSTGRVADLPDLMADERRLRQALFNLVTNAIKFSKSAGSVSIAVRLDPAGLSIDVADTGIGIAAEDICRVYEPFTQLDGSLARRYRGAGLGLYITRAIMRAHGGELALKSRLGAGTTATLTFPCDRLLTKEV